MKLAMKLNVRLFRSCSIAAVVLSLCTTGLVIAQAPDGYRRLAPGVFTTIPPQVDAAETVSYNNVVELQAIPDLEWNPQINPKTKTLKEKGKNTPFRRDVWNLEFSFKPMRMMAVDLPQPGNKMRKTMIWYMVYRVKNNGAHLHPEPKVDEHGDTSYEIKNVDFPVTFSPQFTLFSQKTGKSYLDKVMPVAVAAIQKREDPNRHLLDSVEMAATPIPVSTPTQDNSVWGVVTWDAGVDNGSQIDPRTDHFSIFISGLSNAYKFADVPGAYKHKDPPGKGRLYRQKMLQLNFWRPSDPTMDLEGEIFFGIPREIGRGKQIDYQWIFR
ncbi:MAG: hypothetical protein SGJ20_10195 [Planctomycetota bacterium]|nr:hypothetical protein [Planctomycetota bacterium]